jgi:hypothetical protein
MSKEEHMKTLSIRQPWVELIFQKRKTIELRTWKTKYRGKIAIHAAQKMKTQNAEAYDLNPDKLTRGALVGTAELVDIVELDEAQYESLRDEHLSLKDWPGGLYGWKLAQPKRLEKPVEMNGKQGLFTVGDNLVSTEVTSKKQANSTAIKELEQEYNPTLPFEVIVEQRDENSYALALYQWPFKANGVKPQAKKVVTVGGVNLQAVADHVISALKKSGYKATDLSARRRAPFRLNDENGVKLGLLFLTVAPLSRMDRIEAISRELRDMPIEEAYYWYSKCTTPEYAGRAQQALRVLLAAE